MAKIEEQRKALQSLLKELEAGQAKMAEGGLSQTDGEALEAKAKEAEAIQDELDRYAKMQRQISRGREVVDQVLPSGKAQDEEKGDEQAGFMSLGEAFVRSEAYKQAKDRGFPQGMTHEAMVAKGFDVRYGSVPVTKADVQAMRERKAVPTIGAGVIAPQRLTDVVRVTELDALDFLQLLNTSPMSSPSVEWVRVTSYTRAAAPTAAGVAKPEAALATDLVSATAKTIAVWIPVTEQQLQDAQIVINEVDAHLRWDVRKKLEEECLYGSGSGEHFTGLFNDSGVLAMSRAKSSDTLIDKIKRAATDVRVSGFQPNGVALHPYDWEEVVLSKGSDNRYVWVVVTDENGSRIWGMRVSEALGAEETALASNPERNILVGDFQRGTTLYIRDELNVQIGWQSDDFIKNKRTIRAETRGVLATRRPLAFRKILTHASSGTS